MERRFRVRLEELLDDAQVRPGLLRGVLPRSKPGRTWASSSNSSRRTRKRRSIVLLLAAASARRKELIPHPFALDQPEGHSKIRRVKENIPDIVITTSLPDPP
jgi:hypothetical protein